MAAIRSVLIQTLLLLTVWGLIPIEKVTYCTAVTLTAGPSFGALCTGSSLLVPVSGKNLFSEIKKGLKKTGEIIQDGIDVLGGKGNDTPELDENVILSPSQDFYAEVTDYIFIQTTDVLHVTIMHINAASRRILHAGPFKGEKKWHLNGYLSSVNIVNLGNHTTTVHVTLH